MLARRGYAVRLFEGREDPRSGAPRVEGPQDADASLLKSASASKRSINLALSHRGLCAIARVDEALAKRVLEEAVPMRGRIIHGRDGKLSLQPYGTEEDEVLYSIGRQRINVFLLEELRAAEAKPAGSPGSVVTTFGAKLAYASRDGSLEFETPDGTISTTPGRVLGCDGAFSATRKAMGRMCRLSVSLEYIDHGYKEMTMAPAADGSYRMPAGGLHIWPGSDVMLIALPNLDGSFTCTIFGDFTVLESLKTAQQVEAFFGSHWPDSLELIPDLAEQYLANPNGALSTVRCGPWHLDDRFLLLGDAAHAVVPFYGQGMNCALEDCLALDDMLDRFSDDWSAALPFYYSSRKPATDALADLALDNYIEMRDKTVSRVFALKSRVDRALNAILPRGAWQPSLHTAVSFTSMPYHKARAVCEKQDRILLRAATSVAIMGLAGIFTVASRCRKRT